MLCLWVVVISPFLRFNHCAPFNDIAFGKEFRWSASCVVLLNPIWAAAGLGYQYVAPIGAFGLVKFGMF